MKSPSGQILNTITYDDNLKMQFIIIHNIAEQGQWSYDLTVSTSTTDYINLIVSSKPKSASTEAITVECSVPSGTVVPHAALNPPKIVGIVKQAAIASSELMSINLIELTECIFT